MTESTTRLLDVPGAVLVYDVREPESRGGHPPLLVFGSPMAASGFPELVSSFTERTVITYDPQGTERSALDEDADDRDPR